MSSQAYSDAQGYTTVALDGDAGHVSVGGGPGQFHQQNPPPGEDGRLAMQDKWTNETISLEAAAATINVGGRGQNGGLRLFPQGATETTSGEAPRLT